MEKSFNKAEIIGQINSAFSFIQKLFNESSYLIKEIEGQLGESEYRFQILRPSGYGISSRSSIGLESNNVNLWLLRKYSVAFAEEIKMNKNITEINESLKILYFRIILNDNDIKEPEILFGVFYDIVKNKDSVKKFEHLMGGFEYVDYKLFSKFPNVEYEDNTFKIRGKFKKVNLLDINSSDDLMKRIIKPSIKLYESI